jgi:hypothetical protein
MRRGRRLAALRARAERGSTEGERAAARKALAFEEERVDEDEIAARGPAADVEVGAVEPGVWEARDRDGRGTRYQVKVASVEIARDWFLRGAMCILVAADGRRFVARACGYSLPNASGGPAPLVYFARWRELPGD